VEKTAGEETPVVNVKEREIGVIQHLNGKPCLANLLVEAGVAESKGEVKRLFGEGAIYLDNARVEKDLEKLQLHDGENLVRVGKRKYLKLVV
jgi:tyrosyl-tRNA synthetase